MRPYPKIRLYVEYDLNKDRHLELSRNQSHYLRNVMRGKVSDTLAVFNGSDGEWQAEITETGNKSCSILVKNKIRDQVPTPDIWLLCAKVKRGPTELTVQKATELGAARILPITTQHSEAKSANTERLRQIAIEAAEQSERLDIPQIDPLQPLATLIEDWDISRRIIMADESGAGQPIGDVLKTLHPKDKYAILTGPEGGFSVSELEMLRKLPYVTTAGLGPRILKAETAAIALLSCWQALLGDWHQAPRFENRD